MRTRSFDPLHLDVEMFAKDAGQLAGEWPLGELERLSESADPQAPVQPQDQVQWTLSGEQRGARGKDPEIWLALSAKASLSMTCQRCLQPVLIELDVRNSVQFVAGEDEAAVLDAEGDDDVLALTRSLNARALVEDELLLALPLVPRHDRCAAPLALPSDDHDEGESARRQPFAILAKLKSRPDT